MKYPCVKDGENQSSVNSSSQSVQTDWMSNEGANEAEYK